MYRTLLRPLLYLLPAEWAHDLTLTLLTWISRVPFLCQIVRFFFAFDDPRLEVTAFGTTFPNPLGLAAGFDKDARATRALTALGFGHVEVGTLTAYAQPGNPKPRMFRLVADRALVNRMGFNNRGAERAVRALRRRRASVVGVNIGKSKVTPASRAKDDYATSASLLAAHADYVVVNVSSPNTPGLRDLQAVSELGPILQSVQTAIRDACGSRHVPLLVKISPDLSDDDIDAVADLALSLGLDGMIATNTTTSRIGLRSHPTDVAHCGDGGLSGLPLKDRSLNVLRRLRARVGERLVLVSVGGIETADDAWERLAAGATLVQAYTGLVYGGPGFAKRLCRGLVGRLQDAGYRHVREVIGVSATLPQTTENTPHVRCQS